MASGQRGRPGNHVRSAVVVVYKSRIALVLILSPHLEELTAKDRPKDPGHAAKIPVLVINLNMAFENNPKIP